VPLSWAQLTAGHLPHGREGSFALPSPRRRDTGALLAPTTATPLIEIAPATQAMMVPMCMALPQPETNLPIEQCHTHHGGK
jgi:hypothetical protein